METNLTLFHLTQVSLEAQTSDPSLFLIVIYINDLPEGIKSKDNTMCSKNISTEEDQ